MHLLDKLQDEETPATDKDFDGTYDEKEAFKSVKHRYFKLNPGIID